MCHRVVVDLSKYSWYCAVYWHILPTFTCRTYEISHMNWNTCYTGKRIGDTAGMDHMRTQYQRDYDRLIFSSAFRRLQSKTQVFPLPGSTFVHNRLTHSLEVASVGRSLGAMVGEHISKLSCVDPVSSEFYKQDLSNIVAAACLAHDIGNPAFGHSGEAAISNYFLTFAQRHLDDTPLQGYFSEEEWQDLTHFEGNANALRVMAQSFAGKAPGGMGLTISTLASILKYPCSSSQRSTAKHRKKYSYFQSEQAIFRQIVETLGMVPDLAVDGVYRRHPFVYLVEAADDICYRIVDLEDAHRLGIIATDRVKDLLLQVIVDIDNPSDDVLKIRDKAAQLTDDNASVSYLRAKTISTLVKSSVDIFISHADDILKGSYDSTLLDDIEQTCPGLEAIQDISITRIYNHQSVVEIEIAGYNVMSELLQLMVPAVLVQHPNAYQKQALKLLPYPVAGRHTTSPYLRVMAVLDHVSAMTDVYATDLYRKIKGIEISKHR